MDIHIIPGVKARAVAEAHQKDMLIQGEHDCKCMTYWIDEERENVFCLIEASGKEAVEEMHSRAHGLVPNKIIEVSSSLVESFLGRIYDPAEAAITGDGLKVFHDPSFRILMVTTIIDPVLLQYKIGVEKANELLCRHNEVIRKNLSNFEGREVEHNGTGFIGSFSSAAKAVSCALAVQKDLTDAGADATGFRIAINAGEPVSKTDRLFGDTIQSAGYMCTIAENCQVVVAPAVKELVSKDNFQRPGNIKTLAPADAVLLELLFNKLEENWQNPGFNVTDYCQAMAMSKSQLYRKTTGLAGLSPNLLLKEFRLEKAKELMKKQRYTISQITFDSGFTSPSLLIAARSRRRSLTSLPRSKIIGFNPNSKQRKAANNPAGPAPTIKTGLLLFTSG